MDNKSARKIINQSRLDGDNNWINILGPELSKKYMDILNDYVTFLFDANINKIEKTKIEKEYRKRMQEVKENVRESVKNLGKKEKRI